MSHTPPDPRSPKDLWDEQHRLLAEDPVVWVLKADELVLAFETLAAECEGNLQTRPHGPHLSSVAFMLAGFAVEVLLKALLIQTKMPLDEKGRFELRSHHLAQLAVDVGLNLADDESRLLEKLEEFLTWAGRYPIPVISASMRPRPLPSGGFAPRTYHNVGEDWPGVRAFVHKLKQLLPNVPYA